MQITHIPEDAPEMEFEFLIGDVNWEDYGGKWISPKLNNGDFDYWFVIEFLNWLEETGELFDGNEFIVTIQAVSPDEAGEDSLESAYACCGFDEEFLSDYNEEALDHIKVEALSTYGVYAQLWQESGNNADALLRRAKQAANIVSSLFGFFMDTPKNRIGSTGWDVIKGDLLAGLNRMN